ncbi:MAG: hypothetical protein HY296_02445 [Thaumarchaeota archaeon]|nr:hypothetical protein [Nitrososphaerota archaeon]
MQENSLVEYLFDLTKLKPEEVRFMIVDGSMAEGTGRKHSDYDAIVVRKGKNPSNSIGNLFGVFRGRVVSGWLADDDSFRRHYIGVDDEQFLWRRKQLRKARLLYGRKSDFERVISKAKARRWNERRKLAVIKYSYVTMVEYMGKMLNKRTTDEVPEFYQDGYIVGKNAAILVAALNEIDLDSDKNMYQHVISMSKIRPRHFERDFLTSSGLSGGKRERGAVVAASKRLVEWARKETIQTFNPDDPKDPGFWKLVREIRF